MRTDFFNQLVASVREGGAILRREARPNRAFAINGRQVKHIRPIRTNHR